MRAAVIGGSGQIGGWLLRALEARGHDAAGTYATVPYPGLTHLDATDFEAAASWATSLRPDVIFYPAGFTWVDGCERDPSRARNANLEQPLNLARAAGKLGARFVYFSTDYVFDGLSGPYTETSPTNALSVYGQSKLEAEQALATELGDRALILRTTWVFGPEKQGKNFAYQLAKTLAVGKPLVCPSDQRSNPSYGPDIATAAVALAGSGESGIIHVAGPDVMARDEFARGLASGFGLDERLIEARPTAALGQGAPRPLNSGLLTRRLDALLPGAIRPVGEAMADFAERLSSDPSLARPLPC